MVFICPHCKDKGISGFSKFGSRPSNPAVCKLCGKYSCETKGPTEYLNYLAGLSIPLAVFSFFIWQSFALAIVLICIPLVLPFLTLYLFPLSPLEEGTVKSAKKWQYVLILLFFLVGVIGIIVEKYG